MALSNKERVGRVLDAVREGLGPYILREYRMVYKGKAIDEMNYALQTGSYGGLPDVAWAEKEQLLDALDLHGCLNLMWRRWNEVFQDRLGHVARSYVSELIEARNTWAHQGAFTNDEAYRIADTAGRLLKTISAAKAAAYVDEIGKDLLRHRYEEEAKKAKKDTGELVSREITTLSGLKPWRDVIQPHKDVASGRYLQAEFAADLAQVLAGTAEPEYQEPVEFFARTSLTEGLLAMLVSGVKRLTAQGGDPVVQLQTAFGGGKTHSMLALYRDPVVQLQTAFGGGKTHSMLALYHLAGPNFNVGDFPGGEKLMQQIGQVDLPEANRAVLVGTALDPSKPIEYRDATVHTLWGELAYQIGGLEAYKMVETADQKGVSPNSNTLYDLLEKYGPCLVMIDELVAYARNIYHVDGLPSGSFDSVMTFMQALTEAMRRSTDSMLLVSIPASEIEVGGEAGKETLERLSHIIGRIESVWKPVSATESFEIVRRRLFSDVSDFAARDAVVNAFGNMYRNASGEFPAGVSERDYLERMTSAYPIHPEMFDRLYHDWSTLERFQRTRGVLRLMAAVIHQLWTSGDQSLMILPGTVPLHATPVRNELLRYLPDTWPAVFDKDVDGPESLPLGIDGEVPALGKYAATRRVARTIFLGSAPSVAGQSIRGIEEIRVRLGCAQPGEPTAVFGDALRRMGSQLTYLYTDGSRYWYDTRPTVNRLARDRAQAFNSAEVNKELIGRMDKVRKSGAFAGCHVAPLATGDVADEDRVRMLVLHPDATHKRRNGGSPAIKAAKDFLENRGNARRLYKNMLIFLAPDEGGMQSLCAAVREFMAWRSIYDEEEQLNLDAQQQRQVKDSLEKSSETIELRLREAYSWLLVPVQPEPMGGIEIQAGRISGDDNYYERAARKLKQEGLLIDTWSPDVLRLELDRYMWGEDKAWEIGIKQLWEYMAQYVYLPRVSDQQVLIDAVRDGVGRLDAPFAYATGKHEEGYHTGLVYRKLGAIYFDDQSILIHPEHIVEPPEKPTTTSSSVGEEGGESPELRPQPPVEKKTTHYFGSVKVDPQRIKISNKS